MNNARGMYLPFPVSLKKVLKDSPLSDTESSPIWPSGCIPCSRQYNSQQALPICTPACPTKTEITSRCQNRSLNSITVNTIVIL